MPFPQQVINQISRGDQPETPGWSFGIILFSGSLFLLVVIFYIVITFVYEPYLNNQLTNAQNQVSQLSQTVSQSDQAKLLTYYSQITNLQKLLKGHIITSQFLTWLGQNTEMNVYYTKLSFLAPNQISLVANAPTEADVNQQMAIFEASPMIKAATISNVGISGATGVWQFNVNLVISPSLVQASSTNTQASSTTASSTP